MFEWITCHPLRHSREHVKRIEENISLEYFILAKKHPYFFGGFRANWYNWHQHIVVFVVVVVVIIIITSRRKYSPAQLVWNGCVAACWQVVYDVCYYWIVFLLYAYCFEKRMPKNLRSRCVENIIFHILCWTCFSSVWVYDARSTGNISIVFFCAMFLPVSPDESSFCIHCPLSRPKDRKPSWTVKT